MNKAIDKEQIIGEGNDYWWISYLQINTNDTVFLFLEVLKVKLRVLSIKQAKSVLPALPILLLLESTGNTGNVNKHCRVYWRGDVNGKHPIYFKDCSTDSCTVIKFIMFMYKSSRGHDKYELYNFSFLTHNTPNVDV